MNEAVNKSYQGGPTFSSRVWRSTLIVGATVLALLLLWFEAHSLLLIFAGVLFALVLDRLAGWMAARFRLSHGWAVAVVFLVASALTVTLGLLLGSAVAAQSATLWTELPKVAQRTADRVMRNPLLRQVLASSGEPSKLGIAPSTVVSGASNAVVTGLDVLVALVVLVFLTVYGALDTESYRTGLLRLVPPPRRERARQIMDEIAISLFRWMLSRFAAMAVVGVVVWLGLTILHVPFPLALGFLAGTLTFIPYLGAVLSAIPAALLALNNGPLAAVWVLLIFTVAHLVEGYLLTPLLTRHAVRFPPAFTLAVQVVLGGLFGLAGLALATPLAVVAVVIVTRLYVEDTLGDRAE